MRPTTLFTSSPSNSKPNTSCVQAFVAAANFKSSFESVFNSDSNATISVRLEERTVPVLISVSLEIADLIKANNFAEFDLSWTSVRLRFSPESNT